MARNSKKAATEFIGKALELPPGTLTKGANIDIFGNREVLVDDCHGVLEYTDSAIKVNVGNGAVRFCGRNMQIKSLARDQAVIVGYILSIEFIM
jgi:sporulation protein YqfC